MTAMETIIDIVGTIGVALVFIGGITYIACLIYHFLSDWSW